MAPEQPAAPVLPASIVGLVDVGRLIREIEKLEDALRSDELRSGGAQPALPKLSPLLEQVAEQNKLDLTDKHQRQSTLEFLKLVRKEAPRVHMSFSANPSTEFVQKLMMWLRQNVHPHVLVAIGLQPGIGAGCVLRTTNKYFDMSLSRSFADSRKLLMERLRSANEETGASITPATPAEVSA